MGERGWVCSVLSLGNADGYLCWEGGRGHLSDVLELVGLSSCRPRVLAVHPPLNERQGRGSEKRKENGGILGINK